MPIEVRLLAWAALLGLIQIIAAGAAANPQRGFDWALGPRDEPRPPPTGLAGRLERASRNFLETFPLFAAVVLAAAAIDRHNGLIVTGAHLYFWSRLVYLPAYALAVPYLRSIAWGTSLIGILLVFAGLAPF